MIEGFFCFSRDVFLVFILWYIMLIILYDRSFHSWPNFRVNKFCTFLHDISFFFVCCRSIPNLHFISFTVGIWLTDFSCLHCIAAFLNEHFQRKNNVATKSCVEGRCLRFKNDWYIQCSRFLLLLYLANVFFFVSCHLFKSLIHFRF